jgi:DNA adenine methylase
VAALGEAAGATPIIKWVGGKSRLLSELVPRVPTKYGRYFEPFCGGAALFFRLSPQRAVLADANRDLMRTYEAVRDDADAIIRLLAKHAKAHSKRHFYVTRDRWNAGKIKTKPTQAAAFIYFNKTCFNGLWRVNRDGAFNVPMGRYTDPPICVPGALRSASTAFSCADLRNTDYRDAVTDTERGDFVYFDPPYDPVTTTSNFTSYTAAAFGADDQRVLADLARTLVRRKVRVLLSNSDTPFIRGLYRDFKLDRVKCRRSINSNATKRGAVNELIIAGGF